MPSARKRRKGPAWGKIIAVAAVCAALALAWRYTPLSEFLTGERIVGWARAVRGTWWAPIVVVLAYTPSAFVMFPRPVLTLLTVIAFGPWLGFAYSMAGIMLSAWATYYAGRVLKPGTVRRLGGDRFDDLTRALRDHGLAAVFAMRIVPAAPFAVEGIICGAIKIRQRDYLLGTFLGMLPGVLATSMFGDQIATALEDLSRVNYWVIGLAALLLVAAIYLVGRWFHLRVAK